MAAPDKPRVTVLITLYNKGPFVAEAIASVLANTFTDFELLVVDDGSTDDGPAIVQRLADPRIHLLMHDRNTGRADAAARGFSAAQGEYVVVLDADDTMSPERIARQVAFMDAHPEVGASGSAAAIMGKGDHVASWPNDDHVCRAGLLFTDPMLYGSCIFRKATLDSHGIRHEPGWQGPGMDYLFQVAMSPHVRFANLPDVLTHYRIHEGNVRYGRDPVADKLRIQRRVFELLGIPFTKEELRVHVLFNELFPIAPGWAVVHRLHRWSRKLERMNAERGLFPHALFKQQLERRWERLFHLICDRSTSGALAHLLLTPGPISNLVYLLKVRVKPVRNKMGEGL